VQKRASEFLIWPNMLVVRATQYLPKTVSPFVGEKFIQLSCLPFEINTLHPHLSDHIRLDLKHKPPGLSESVDFE
jgi:hypothetical protein